MKIFMLLGKSFTLPFEGQPRTISFLAHDLLIQWPEYVKAWYTLLLKITCRCVLFLADTLPTKDFDIYIHTHSILINIYNIYIKYVSILLELKLRIWSSLMWVIKITIASFSRKFFKNMVEIMTWRKVVNCFWYSCISLVGCHRT